jgi:Flp pilus assembly protein TadB
MTLREDYGLPRRGREPIPVRMWGLVGLAILAALVLWLVLPDSPVTVAVIAVAVLAFVFLGVYRILNARQISRPPDRDPRPPPSTQ